MMLHQIAENNVSMHHICSHMLIRWHKICNPSSQCWGSQIFNARNTYMHKPSACKDLHLYPLDLKGTSIPLTVIIIVQLASAKVRTELLNIYSKTCKENAQTSAIFWSIVIGSNMRTGRVTIDVTSEPTYFCIIFQ